MKKLREFIMIDCFAFTVTALFNGVVITLNNQQQAYSLSEVLTIFMITSIIAFLVVLTDTFCQDNQMLRQLCKMLDVIVPVLLYAMFTTDFKLSLEKVITNIVVCLFIYGIVCLMMVISWREKDHKANESLQRMRERRKKM